MTHLGDNTPTPKTMGALPTIPQTTMDSQQQQTPSVPVSKVHVPLPAMLAVVAFMLGGVVSVTLVWAKAVDPQRHVMPTMVTNGGGVAYKNDVKDARHDFEKALLNEHRQTRKMLKGMVLSCKKQKGSPDLRCTVNYLPEPE